ncbi:EKC/KEOPS complex subunit LAGE3 [Holothuria leucospilota]|uniref:L antigen family member 3 n=1 Tax=Holothuria leucospilota TaxID=206669 RepID=A0A9Q1CLF3_HOLLE|nr:EKC/KEOPS complex subunit LAGE3 [Holothuria leucospilota]
MAQPAARVPGSQLEEGKQSSIAKERLGADWFAIEFKGSSSGLNFVTSLSEMKIPFPSDREAEIAYNSLRVDKEPRKSQITKELNLDGNVLLVNFTATEARFLRVAVGSFFDLLNLVVKTMEEFGPPLERTLAAQTKGPNVTNDVS